MITPALMFTEQMCGKAEEAGDFYVSVFKNVKRGTVSHYPAGMDPDTEDETMYSDFMLENQWFAAMDSAREHSTFNEAISFVVNCADQTEVDYYWEKLSAVPEAEQCGWLKDRYGVSWQIVPTEFLTMLTGNDEVKSSRVMEAMLKMKKLDIQTLREAAGN